MVFNSSRTSFSQGDLSDGFQGRPGLSIYKQGLKESQNFFSNADGVGRFRKTAKNSKVAAPLPDSSDTTTGTYKTITFFAGIYQYFLDFCKDKSTGKYTIVYIRLDDTDVTPVISGASGTSISSSSADGTLNLSAPLADELHRVGTRVRITSGSPVNGIIAEADSASKDVVKIVQEDGQAFTALPSQAGNTLTIAAAVFTNPIEADFDWDAGENQLLIVDGTNRYRFEVTSPVSIPNNVTITENYTITADPFASRTKPSKVTFYQNRAVYSGCSGLHVAFVAMSKAPNATTGAVQYHDFTTGTAATDPILIYLAPGALVPITGVKWIRGSNKALLAGVNNGVAEITSTGAALTPTDVNVGTFSFRGPSEVTPVVFDNYVNWASIDNRRVYESSFSFDYDAELSYNLSLLTYIRSTIKQVVPIISKEEGLMILLDNGTVLLGLRNQERNMSFFPLSFPLGYKVTARDTVLNIFTYGSATGQKIFLNVLLSETTGSAAASDTYKILEIDVDSFFEDVTFYFRSELFPYMDDQNKIVLDFFNGIRRAYLDDSHTYYATLADTISGTGTYLILNTSDDSDYDLKVISDTGTTLAGKEIAMPELGIVIKYALEITAGGNFYANYVVEGANLDNFDLANNPILIDGEALDSMFVDFTTFNISSINDLIPDEAKVYANGKEVSSALTSDSDDYGYYTVTLTDSAFFCHVGLKYTGMFTMLPFSNSGTGQLGYNRPKAIAKLKIRLINSGDGTAYINRIKEDVFDFKAPWVLDWKPYLNGVYTTRPLNSWDEVTELTIFQKEPQPLNVSLLEIFQEVTND